MANILIDPLTIISFPLDHNSLSLWSITLVIIISSIIYFKRKSFIKINADWKSMVKKETFPEEINLSQVKNQLNENMRAVKITIKIMSYFFTIIFIGSFEDTIKSFFVHVFNAHNFGSWYILFYCFGEGAVLFLFASWLIAGIYNISKSIYNVSKSLLNRIIENGLFVKDYALLYAAQKILEETNNKNLN